MGILLNGCVTLWQVAQNSDRVCSSENAVWWPGDTASLRGPSLSRSPTIRGASTKEPLPVPTAPEMLWHTSQCTPASDTLLSPSSVKPLAVLFTSPVTSPTGEWHPTQKLSTFPPVSFLARSSSARETGSSQACAIIEFF